MVTYRCDGCGAEMHRHALRYTVTIDVRAAYDEIEIGLADLVRSHRQEILALIERLRHCDPAEIEEQVYKQFRLDLCPACQRAYLRDPLRFRPPAVAERDGIGMDEFLRSLGFGGPDRAESPEES